MKRVKVADAKNNLSRYLRLVQGGARIRILHRDTPIADLVPVADMPQKSGDAQLLASLARRGIIRLGTGGALPRDLLRPGPPDPAGRGLAVLFDERRRSR
jgi:antitoxin (DNA-binding transcriptional repressor) of toxin-antitoxin stability system